MKVIVTGSLGYDYIMDFPGRFADRIMPDKIHEISLSFVVEKLVKQFGGTAGNIAYTLKLLGLEPLILSAAGNDFSQYKDFLKSHQIRTDYISVIPHITCGIYFVVTDKQDNQIGSFYAGAMTHNRKLALKSVKDKAELIIIASNNPDAMQKYVREALSLKIPYMYDPAFQIDNLSATELTRGISGAKILIGNDYEIELITQKLKITHQQLLAMSQIVVTTLGVQGSLIETNSAKFKIRPARPRSTSDPTGAGDAYRAGFLAGYLRGFDLTTCGQMGSLAAVYTVEKYGTITHKFTRTQFIRRFQSNFGKRLTF